MVSEKLEADCVCGDPECRLWLEHEYSGPPAPPVTTRAPADLRSALEAETIERCAKVAEAERVDADATRHPEDRAYNVACEHIAEAIRDLAPTKEPAA